MLINLALLGVGALLLWARSLTGRRIHSLSELWGPAFVLLAFSSLVQSEFGGARPLVAFVLTLVWAGRLWWHTWSRARIWPRSAGAPAKEDRYLRRRRRDWGTAFRRRSLVRVFGFQLVAVWVCSLAVQHAIVDAAPLSIGAVDLLALLLWGGGLAVTVVADRQLEAGLDGPLRKTCLVDAGLWRYSRHPNHFGEILTALGFYFLAAGGGMGLQSIAAPAMFAVLLTRLTGAPRIEHGIVRRRPDYARYQATTSRLLPMSPLELDPEPPADDQDDGLEEWTGPPKLLQTWDTRGA